MASDTDYDKYLNVESPPQPEDFFGSMDRQDKEANSVTNQHQGEDSDHYSRSSSPFGTGRQMPSPGPPFTQIPRKRLLDDQSQFVEATVRRVRLKPAHQQELRNFSQMSAEQQNICLAALIMKNTEELERVQPTDIPYQIPNSLEVKIEKVSFLVLLDPTLPGYVKDDIPVKRVIDFLRRYPSWGLTQQIYEDPSKLNVVVTRIRDCLITFRNLIKVEIERSMGFNDSEMIDIVTLCESITKLKPKLAPDLKVNVKLAARVAFLRAIFAKNEQGGKVDRTYWKKVDNGLVSIRGYEDSKITIIFSNILKEDREKYGQVDLRSLQRDAPNLMEDSFEEDATDGA